MKRALKKSYQKLRFKLSSSNNPLFTLYIKYLSIYKVGSLDRLLDVYSRQNLEHFTIIQIGANDGIDNDPVHKFIKRDNWKGVLLEPQSYVFHKYLKKLYAKQKGIHCINAAIGLEEGSMLLYQVAFSEARWATGLASFKKEVLDKIFENGYAAKKAKKEGIQIPADPEKWIKTESVNVITPKQIFKDYNLHSLNLLQIDTEGFDFEVIKMFDIKNTKPGLISFEHIHLSDSDRNACTEYLQDCGYTVQLGKVNGVAMLVPIDEFYQFTE